MNLTYLWRMALVLWLTPVLVLAQRPGAKPGSDEAARERAMRAQNAATISQGEAWLEKETSRSKGFYYGTPNTRAVVWGRNTVLGYRLSHDARMVLGSDSPSGRVLIRLPPRHRQAVPELLGMLWHGSGIELFLGWVDPGSGSGNAAHHIEVFRGQRGGEAVLVHGFTLLEGAAIEGVTFFEPPDTRDAPTVLIDIQGGAYWGTTYLLSPDRRSLVPLFTFCDYEFADLDGDGVYELIAWNRRPFDVRCMFGLFEVRYYPEVFVRAGDGYRKAWPPRNWAAYNGSLTAPFTGHEQDAVPWGANLQIVAGFADLAGDGVAELIVLQDHLQDEPNQARSIGSKTSPFASWRERHCRRSASPICCRASETPRLAKKSWSAQPPPPSARPASITARSHRRTTSRHSRELRRRHTYYKAIASCRCGR
ncbi:MAG: hypothetical protein WBW33_30200 [Bryobacteraceae bacterium]